MLAATALLRCTVNELPATFGTADATHTPGHVLLHGGQDQARRGQRHPGLGRRGRPGGRLVLRAGTPALT